MELPKFKLSPKILPYQALGLLTALMGFLCTFYLPVIEVVLEVDLVITIKSTESFTLQSLREQMIERDMDVRNTSISIAVLLLGSFVNVASVKKVRLLLIGSILQLTSFIILYYDATSSSTGDDTGSFLSDALSVKPTIWLYILLGGIVVAVTASIGKEVIRLVSAYGNNQ